ncbi:DUF779 domain-containing protein [Psychroflexus tropicus]|uniref:DUF779 domain-containing protein n=1 Tax=Psychroflexus tropicus TaxID=197345 RepID=UPI0003689F25|nr:DUF779 domain-containing protein [Psychroflexus tropicus]
MKYTRVDITEKAEKVLNELKSKHGEVIFHQSGGCCDGSSPMLLPKEDFYLDDSDVLLGEVGGVNFYMNEAQFEYWKHTHLTVDITEGRGSSFSLEIPEGYRFIIQSRLLSKEEEAHFTI